MNETNSKCADADMLSVALLSGSSSPLTASYPMPTMALVRELFIAWRGRR